MLAVLGQALFAGTNFLCNVLLARWLAPSDYGAFALAYSIFLFMGALYTAIVSEPMMVFGAAKYGPHLKSYVAILLRFHFVLTVPCSLVFLAGWLILGDAYQPTVGRALLGLAAAAPFILLMWIARRIFYVCVQPAWSVIGGVIYLLLLLASLWGLRLAHLLSPISAFLGMSVGGLLASGFLILRFNPQWISASRSVRLGGVAADHWRYGRWSMATAAVTWVPDNLYYPLLATQVGLGAAGALRALMNLAMPMLQSMAAICTLVLPVLVQSRQQGGRGIVGNRIKLLLGLFLGGSLLYVALVYTFRLHVFHLLYADKYQEYSSLPLLLVCLVSVGASMVTVFGCALRAFERPNWIFRSYFVSTLLVLPIGVWLAIAGGVGGAAGAIVLSYGVTGLLMFGSYRRIFRYDEA